MSKLTSRGRTVRNTVFVAVAILAVYIGMLSAHWIWISGS